MQGFQKPRTLRLENVNMKALFFYPLETTEGLSHLQVCPDKCLATRVVKVALHEEVEQMGCIAADGAQLGVTTLQDLIAESGTHVSAPFKKCAGKLEGEEDKQVVSYGGHRGP